MTKAHVDAVRRYDAKMYDRYTLRLTKDDMDRVKAHIAAVDPPLTINAYITDLIQADLGEGESK